MEAQFQSLLTAVETGDVSALGPLADILEQRGDGRAGLARNALGNDVEIIARILYASFRSERNPVATATAIAADLAVAALTLPLFPISVGPESAAEWLPGALSLEDCRREVTEALATGRHSELLGRAMAEARQIKTSQFLALFHAGAGEDKTS